MKLSNNKILITGGATGIRLCGRRESALEEVTKKIPGVITTACDVSTEAERIELFNWISNDSAM